VTRNGRVADQVKGVGITNNLFSSGGKRIGMHYVQIRCLMSSSKIRGKRGESDSRDEN